MQKYVHNEIGKEVRSISGFYVYTEEQRLKLGNRDVLCIMGTCVIDNSCCGTGGFNFIKVPGYIISWKTDVDASGDAVSEVEPVRSEEEKEEIKKSLLNQYPYSQINFD